MMAIYLSLIALTVVCGIAGEFVSRKKEWVGKLIKIAIPLLGFYLMATLKSTSVGTDTAGYASFYIQIGESEWPNIEQLGLEYGYCLMCKIFYSMGFSWNAFTAVGYLLVFVPIGILLYWRSQTPTTSFLMLIALFMTMWLSAYRQSIASSLAALGIACFCSKKNPFKVIGFMLILVATAFHESAYIALLVVPFYFVTFTKGYLLIAVMFAPLFFFLTPYIYQTAYLLIFNTSSYMPSIYEGGGLFVAYLLMLIVMVLFYGENKFTRFVDSKAAKIDDKFSQFSRYIPLTDKEPKIDKYVNVAMWAMLTAMVIQATCRANLVLSRLHNVMVVTAVICFPSIINSFKSKSVRTCLYALMDIALIFLFFFDVLRGNTLNILPYSFFF